MATVSIPTREPPFCPSEDSVSAMNAQTIPMLWWELLVVAFMLALVTVCAALLCRWSKKQRRCSNSTKQCMLPPPPCTTQTSAKLADKIDFLERVGSSYGYANSKRGFIDDWRSSEFPTLLRPLKLPQRFFRQQKPYPEQTREDRHCDNFSEPEVYLDYAGSAIPTRTLLSRISQSEQILANPHSMGGGLASDRTLKLMQLANDRVMQHFGIQHESFGVDELDKNDVNEEHDNSCAMPCPGYQLIFTSGATESLRLIAERFPWGHAKITADQSSHMRLDNANNGALPLKLIQAQSILLYPRNVHTSVIGMRNIAMQRGAQFQCVLVDELLDATCDWFQNLIKGAMSYAHREVEVHHAEEKDEEKKEEQHSSAAFQVDDFRVQIESADAIEDSTSCKTVWMHHLLVLPLECNFGGDRFDWSRTTAMARKSSFSSFVHCSSAHHPQSTTIQIRHKWHILLDTTKAAATSPINLRTLAAGGPDFAVISFYKLFGSPTGLGALFVRKNPRKRRNEVDHTDERDKTRESPVIEASCITKQQSMMSEHLLSGRIVLERNVPSRQFFGGGSVDLVMPEKDMMVPRNTSRAASVTLESDEDQNIDLGVMVHGTEHFRGIANLTHGFQELDDVGGMEAISTHASCLAAELVRRLGKLVHDNGKPVVELYGQWKSFANALLRLDHSPGPTVAFNIHDLDGSPIGYDEVSRLASLNCPPIQLRTGCFCNPGACQDALPLTNSQVLKNYASGHVCGDRRGVVNGIHTGAIRASFGKDSLWEDMDTLARFVERVFVSRGEARVPKDSPLEQGETSSETNVTSLFVYPIKSCAAVKVKRWPIDRRTGRMAFDREFALVDTSGSAMRLHSHPKMSEIHSTIDLDTKILTVTAPNHEDLIINLKKPSTSDNFMSPEDIQVCGNLCKGNIWGGSNASRWFSSVLGVRCWLARHYDAGETENMSLGGDKQFAYCNEASLLLVSQQSISYLNSVIASQGWGRLVESRHFRPNIVVTSTFRGDSVAEKPLGKSQEEVANPEDSWQQIIIRGSIDVVELTAVGKCARCQMVDIDPSSGMKGNTLRALAQYRRDRGRINFGTFFTGNVDASEGTAWLEEESVVEPRHS